MLRCWLWESAAAIAGGTLRLEELRPVLPAWATEAPQVLPVGRKGALQAAGWLSEMRGQKLQLQLVVLGALVVLEVQGAPVCA